MTSSRFGRGERKLPSRPSPKKKLAHQIDDNSLSNKNRFDSSDECIDSHRKRQPKDAMVKHKEEEYRCQGRQDEETVRQPPLEERAISSSCHRHEQIPMVKATLLLTDTDVYPSSSTYYQQTIPVAVPVGLPVTIMAVAISVAVPLGRNDILPDEAICAKIAVGNDVACV